MINQIYKLAESLCFSHLQLRSSLNYKSLTPLPLLQCTSSGHKQSILHALSIMSIVYCLVYCLSIVALSIKHAFQLHCYHYLFAR